MISDALNIAASSLKTQQKALDVIAHNVANSNTEGYSRQNPTLVTALPEKLDQRVFGRGVELGSINRIVDPLINHAQKENLSQFSFFSTLSSGLTAVENVFGSLESTGVSAALDDFFLSWQQFSSNPQDQAQKFNVRNKSEVLAIQLSNMHEQLRTSQVSADQEIDQRIKEANILLDEIASLTTQIRQMQAGQQGALGGANDLLDQREQSVRALSTLVPIQQVNTADGDFLIQTKGGDLLTQDNVSRHLGRSSSLSVNGFTEIVIESTGVPVSGLDQGGAIGGLVSLRDGHLGNYIQTLDEIALNLTFGVNQILASSGGNVRASSLISGQGSLNPALALNDAAQALPLANQIQTGSFKLHLYSAAGTPITPGGTTINITAGVTTITDVANSINAIAGITASVDSVGRLVIDAGTNTIGFSDDSSNFLPVYEINTLFHGSGAGGMTISTALQNNAALLSAGTIDPATSIVYAGDNTAAIAVMQLQDSKISFDGSVSETLHVRSAVLSTRYGDDFAIADQQLLYRQVESESLSRQREAVSGVNVDEEMISMIKFQRAYEAAAKVIQTTNQMLDSLLGLIR
ncbi:MAG: flagellar hook-associated protein FlgK [Mariprofundaceae bacterium]